MKNFAYLMDRSGTWRLAPAFDLVFSEGPGGQHTMAVAGEAKRPAEPDMLRVAAECDVDARLAKEIIRQVVDTVRQWPRFARATGVSSDTEREIGKVIDSTVN